jgi:hypothetical protein
VLGVMRPWGKRIGYSRREIDQVVAAAFRPGRNQGWAYPSPGLRKRPGVYQRALEHTCLLVGCPAQCPAFSEQYVGPRDQDFKRFRQLGWVKWLKQQRWSAAVDTYQAICFRERDLGFKDGAPLHVTYAWLGEHADRDKSKVGENCERLRRLGLLTLFERGSGSGPAARDRRASKVQRAIPIPPVPRAGLDSRTMTTDGATQRHIGGDAPHSAHPVIGGLGPLDIGGLAPANGRPSLLIPPDVNACRPRDATRCPSAGEPT